MPRFAKCRFALIIECNLEQGSALCESALNNFTDCDIVCQTSHAYGIFTAPGSKMTYFMRVRNLLAREAISFYETIISASPFQAAMSRRELAVANMTKLEQEFRSYRYVYLPPSLAGAPRAVLTGHADHENKYSERMQDDLVLVTSFGINAAMDLLADPPYMRLRTRTNRLY